MRVYIAASWRTPQQPDAVALFREAGHEVYDFRDNGFGWREVDPAWPSWSHADYLMALVHPRARDGFLRDKAMLDSCDACVLLVPSGRSAHLELGYAIGKGKLSVVVLLETPVVPDLMYLLADRRAVTLPQAIRQLTFLGHKRGL